MNPLPKAEVDEEECDGVIVTPVGNGVGGQLTQRHLRPMLDQPQVKHMNLHVANSLISSCYRAPQWHVLGDAPGARLCDDF